MGKDIKLITQIRQKIHQAVLSGEKEKVEAWKYLLSLLEKERLRRGKLTDQEGVKILQGELKRKKEALALFEKGGRQDLVAKEKKEIKLLEEFLPQQASQEEIKRVIEAVVAEVGRENFGRLMGEVMSRLQGRASGQEVAQLVREKMGQ